MTYEKPEIKDLGSITEHTFTRGGQHEKKPTMLSYLHPAWGEDKYDEPSMS